MYITPAELAEYTGVNADPGSTLPETYCGAACAVVNNFLGYEPEKSERTVTVIADGSGMVALGAPVRELLAVSVGGVDTEPGGFVVSGQYLSGNIPKGSVVTARFTGGWDGDAMAAIRMAALRIAGCMSAEADGNIGVSSKSFGETGSRVFLNSKYDRYLEPLEPYRVYRT